MEEAWDVNLVGQVVLDGDDLQVTLAGELDTASAPVLQERLYEVIGSTSGTVVLNMSGVSFIDSMGIRAVVAVRRRLSEQGRSLVLRDVSPQTRRLLDLTGLGPMLHIDRGGVGSE